MRKPPNTRPCMFCCCGCVMKVFCSTVLGISTASLGARAGRSDMSRASASRGDVHLRAAAVTSICPPLAAWACLALLLSSARACLCAAISLSWGLTGVSCTTGAGRLVAGSRWTKEKSATREGCCCGCCHSSMRMSRAEVPVHTTWPRTATSASMLIGECSAMSSTEAVTSRGGGWPGRQQCWKAMLPARESRSSRMFPILMKFQGLRYSSLKDLSAVKG
mmetsp:Transcript_25743/g.56087  ORF Transcript_25743/g.56087 Transcript_25743/m.56087 type:complete len:220 (+) Transcript_25743:285-944(+)